jgi:REP element-mobilizing transposase RayT
MISNIMSDKYKNKYRIPSARAHWWDYSWNGAYFITICTANREHFFGEIENQKMILSRTGVIADLLWHEIPNHSKFVEIGDFIVMPNHIHGILILDKPDVDDNVDDNVDNVETLHATSLRYPRNPRYPSNLSKNQKMSAISPKSNSISSIIRSYKSAVTKHANRLGLPHSWQSRFHDHIIRNDAEYQRISDYIVSNALNWEKDKFNP